MRGRGREEERGGKEGEEEGRRKGEEGGGEGGGKRREQGQKGGGGGQRRQCGHPMTLGGPQPGLWPLRPHRKVWKVLSQEGALPGTRLGKDPPAGSQNLPTLLDAQLALCLLPAASSPCPAPTPSTPISHGVRMPAGGGPAGRPLSLSGAPVFPGILTGHAGPQGQHRCRRLLPRAGQTCRQAFLLPGLVATEPSSASVLWGSRGQRGMPFPLRVQS